MRRQALDVGESFQIALSAIRANKARGALTTLGIIIGIVAVILTLTAAHGLQTTFRQSFSSVGTDVVYVSRMPWVIMNDFFLYRNRPPLELRHAEHRAGVPVQEHGGVIMGSAERITAQVHPLDRLAQPCLTPKPTSRPSAAH